MSQEHSLPQGRDLARLLDLTLRRGDATAREIEAACRAARAEALHGVCVNSSRVAGTAHWLEDSGLKVTCAVDFPLGAADPDTKRFETEAAIDNGADFIELAANLGRLKDGDDAAMLREWRDVIEAADERPVSVRFDPGLIEATELDRLCRLAGECGVHGLTLASAGVDAVRAVRSRLEERIWIKVDVDELGPDAIPGLWQAGARRFGLRNAIGFASAR